MLLGGLLHAGVDRDYLLSHLEKLKLPGLEFTVEDTIINGISALQVNINSEKRQDLRTLPAILKLLEKSDLPKSITQKATDVFHNLAKAEAKIHRLEIAKVHFHEVGALDTIVDIVGTIVSLDYLNITRLICSPLPAGHGFIKCDHGLIPNPAPATTELLINAPVYGVDLPQELVTPTGAALVATLCDGFGPQPPLAITAVGYGAGTRTLSNGQPNLLRVIVGKEIAVEESQQVEVIECNLDDYSPEGFPYLYELLFAKGALDVTLTPVQMKKGRPGYTIQVISAPASSMILKDIILTETSAIGLRFRQENRQTLKRKIVQVKTRWGQVAAKQIDSPVGPVIYPEYEECRQIALQHQVPLQAVYNAVRNSGKN